MKTLVLILLPIAASNLFGIFKYFLIGPEVPVEEFRLWRLVPVLMAVILAIVIAKTKNKVAVYLGVSVLSFGATASLVGIWLGFQVGSNIALSLAAFWLVAFGFSAYKLPLVHRVPDNA